MVIKDKVTTTEQFELEISMERLLKIIAEGIKAGDYWIYYTEPSLEVLEEFNEVTVGLNTDECNVEDIFTSCFAEDLQQVLKDEANNNKQKGKTNETND